MNENKPRLSNGSRDSAYAPLVTRTDYPYGTDGYSVTIDPLGVQTVTRTYYAANDKITETASAGVTNRTTEVWGGDTVEEDFKTDPVSGEALLRVVRTETSWDANGCETVTVSVSRNDGAWATESVTRKDFLGRDVAVSVLGAGGAMLVTSNAYDTAGRLAFTRNPDGSADAYAYDALGNVAGSVRIGAGQTLDFDPAGFGLAGVIALDKYVIGESPAWKEESDLGLSVYGVPHAWWDCTAAVSHMPGQGAVTTSVVRAQLTGLSPACVGRTVSSDIDGVTSVTAESLDAANAGKTMTRLNAATAESETSVAVAGRVTGGTNALGAAFAYLYDGFARQTAASQAAGDRTLLTLNGYHADGSVAFTTEADGAATNVTSYSARQSLEAPGGAYSVIVTDALGNATTNSYSGDGSLYRSGGAVYPTATARDADGRRSALHTWRDASGQPDVTRWFNDAAGYVTNKVYADGLGPSYAYLPDGRLSLRTWARGVETAYGYADTANGQTRTDAYSDATPDVTSRHDLAGRLVSVEDGTGTRTFAYDARERVTAETNALDMSERQYGSAGQTFSFSQTLPGYGEDTLSVFYGYDKFGRVASVSSAVPSIAFGFSYLPGTTMVAGMTNTAGQVRAITFESERNVITAVSNVWQESPVAVFAYGSDALGRRFSRNADTFDYNGRSEVVGESSGSGIWAYAYDAIGNRVWSADNVLTNTYTANLLNQYTSIAGATPYCLSYDPDGNMLTNGVWSFAWDAENRLTGAASNGVPLVSNAYDWRHRRVRKATSAGTRLFAYDGWNLTAEVFVDAQTGVTNVTRYLWGPDLSGTLQGAGGVGGLLAEMRSDGSIFFPCYDANGNVTDYVDAYGTVRGHFEYNAFGNTVAMWGDLAHTFKFRFSTKYWDDETGHYYFIGRFYHPILGRWLNRDPIEEVGGKNLFVFTENNGLNRYDPIGFTWSEVIAWFGEWVNGKGETFKAFGPRSNAASDMKNAPGVNKARAFFKDKNKSVKCCSDLSSVTNYKITFGLAGLFSAGFNSTQQFAGRYRVDILVSGCKNNKCELDFELTNITSFKSFLYGIGPSWHREEFRLMGNVTQTIWWTEVYDAKCP